MTMMTEEARAIMLGAARSYFKWKDRSVETSLLRDVYDLAKMGATSANCSPARFVFVTTDEGRDLIKPFLIPSNVEKTMTAPVTVVIGYDLKFYDKVPELFPHEPSAREWFNGDDATIQENAVRNGTLQAAYLMLAARSFGLDCGPMSGYDAAGLDKVIWPDGQCRSNFLCNLGYGDGAVLHPRLPRLSFNEACRLI